MATIARVICDLCKEDLQPNEMYLNAGVYGVEAHYDCFAVLSPFEVVRVLGLDDISHGTYAKWDPTARWWADGYIRNRTVEVARRPQPFDIKARVERRNVALDG